MKITFHCQSAQCKKIVILEHLAYGENCPACGEGHLDDWPVGVEVGGELSEEEQYYKDLERGYAQDRI